MRRAIITEPKNGLSALLDQVRAGRSVLILDRGVPIARIEPITSAAGDHLGRIERPERAGLVGGPARELDMSALDTPRPRAAGGASVLAALLV